jgi:hypothetical protein
MGINLSISGPEAAGASEGGDVDQLSPVLATTNQMKLSERNVAQLIDTYYKHQFLSIVPVAGLRNLFEASFGHRALLEENSQILTVLTVSQNMFRDELTISTQEVLVGLVLLCDAPWSARAALLFNIFKCVGTEELGHEDLLLASQMVVVVLCRLWSVQRWSAKTISALTETIADGAFTRLELEIDECINQTTFVAWATERFHESNAIDSSESLRRLYTNPPHIQV